MEVEVETQLQTAESTFTVDPDAVFSLRLASRPPVRPELQLTPKLL